MQGTSWCYLLLLQTLLFPLLPALLLACTLIPRPLHLSSTSLSQTLQAAEQHRAGNSAEGPAATGVSMRTDRLDCPTGVQLTTKRS